MAAHYKELIGSHCIQDVQIMKHTSRLFILKCKYYSPVDRNQLHTFLSSSVVLHCSLAHICVQLGVVLHHSDSNGKLLNVIAAQ